MLRSGHDSQQTHAGASRSHSTTEWAWSGDSARCSCPAHADRTPSLSIRQCERGMLVTCHAGCDSRDVLRALSRVAQIPALERTAIEPDNIRSATVHRTIWLAGKPTRARLRSATVLLVLAVSYGSGSQLWAQGQVGSALPGMGQVPTPQPTVPPMPRDLLRPASGPNAAAPTPSGPQAASTPGGDASQTSGTEDNHDPVAPTPAYTTEQSAGEQSPEPSNEAAPTSPSGVPFPYVVLIAAIAVLLGFVLRHKRR